MSVLHPVNLLYLLLVLEEFKVSDSGRHPLALGRPELLRTYVKCSRGERPFRVGWSVGGPGSRGHGRLFSGPT
jgi:hypothetical protein